MNKHKGDSIKHVKTIASENKTKKSPKSEVDSPDLPSFLGLGDERKQKHKQKNDENQIKNPNPSPNREKYLLKDNESYLCNRLVEERGR